MPIQVRTHFILKFIALYITTRKGSMPSIWELWETLIIFLEETREQGRPIFAAYVPPTGVFHTDSPPDAFMADLLRLMGERSISMDDEWRFGLTPSGLTAANSLALGEDHEPLLRAIRGS